MLCQCLYGFQVGSLIWINIRRVSGLLQLRALGIAWVACPVAGSLPTGSKLPRISHRIPQNGAKCQY